MSIDTSTEPTVTTSGDHFDELLEVARDMKPRLVKRAAQTESERRIPQETIDELTDAGFFKYMVPKRFEGFGGGCIGQVALAAELARGCPSTAWVYTLVGDITAFVGAYLEPDGAQSIYGSAAPALSCGVTAPHGTATQVAGGYRVSGSWGFASGCLHSSWFMGGTNVVDDLGNPVTYAQMFMPMESLSIQDTWHVVGMRGTGSNTVVAQDVFVPSQHVVSVSGRLAREAEFHPGDEPVDRIPFAPFFSIGLMGPTLGAATELQDLVSSRVDRPGPSYFDFATQADAAVLVAELGETAMLIDTAKLHVRRGAGELEISTADHVLDRVTRARCRADAAHAAENLRRAADKLMSVSGGGAFASASRLQQYWRDINVGTRHAFLNTRPLYEAYAREVCGLPNTTQFI
ncbi:acyl-CoA dehydrogenase family protein [Nocardia aobensis]|uniref:Acyl-CoA dehydrogenase family protein n=1 Tax=Nocardia aobensis TaxID=257277 RepID=A0ABW6PFR5_9NOCA